MQSRTKKFLGAMVSRNQSIERITSEKHFRYIKSLDKLNNHPVLVKRVHNIFGLVGVC